MRYQFGDCTLDAARRELSRGGEPVHVEPQVFDLLLHLIRNRERVVSKDELLDAVWRGRIVSESTLSNRINAARRVIGDSGVQQNVIRTVARRGLRFVGEVREEVAAANLFAGMSGGNGGAADEASPAFPAAGAAEGGGPTLAQAGNQTATSRPEFQGKPVIAVLPFTNMSGDPEQEYFSDGITEDIMTALAKHRSLLVIARNSTFTFKGHGSDVRRLGQELGADYVVEGSVRKFAGRVRITAHLIETEGGRLIWADRYDRGLEEIFDVQDEITTTIAARIEPGVSTAERLRAERKAPQALHAWDFLHLGTKHLYKSTAEDNREAQRLLRRAVELDPHSAQAHAFLSYATILSMIYFDADPDDERLSEAVAIARKGVELDDQDGLIRFVYGRALLAQRAYGDSLAELDAAIELNPGLAIAYCGFGDSLAYEGRFSEAFPYFQKAIDLSPFDPQRWAFFSYRALAHLFAREFDESVKWTQKAVRIPGCHYWPFAHRAAALGHLQRPDETRTAVAELLQRKPEFSSRLARKRLFYVANPAHLDIYIEGLRRAGVPD